MTIGKTRPTLKYCPAILLLHLFSWRIWKTVSRTESAKRLKKFQIPWQIKFIPCWRLVKLSFELVLFFYSDTCETIPHGLKSDPSFHSRARRTTRNTRSSWCARARRTTWTYWVTWWTRSARFDWSSWRTVSLYKKTLKLSKKLIFSGERGLPGFGNVQIGFNPDIA